MQHMISKDGTRIAYEQFGQGPALIIVGGLLDGHTQQAGLARLLSEHFTVYNFDRRGHGESGDTPPYAIEREAEDISALLDLAGGSAFVYGTSGCAIVTMEVAARGLSSRFKKMALWEPPYRVDDSRPPVPGNFLQHLKQLLAEGRREDMIKYFFAEGVGMPAEFVEMMPQFPGWENQVAHAHTLVYDVIATGGENYTVLPKERLAKATTEALVIDGGTWPWISHSTDAVAAALPNARRYTIAGQPHNVADEAMAPVLIEYFQA